MAEPSSRCGVGGLHAIGSAMTRRHISVLVIATVVLALFIFAPDVILTIFAGVLVAVLLRAGGTWIAARLRVRDVWGIAIFMVLLVALIAAAVRFFAPSIVEQANELARQLPDVVSQLRERVAKLPWADPLLSRLAPQDLLPGEAGLATTAVTATFGALGNFVLILFIGIYGALDPERYRKGLRALLAPSMRARGDAVMDNAARTLRDWLTAQLMAMGLIGVLTGLGLWILGVPLPLLLGLIAGLLAFIPNIGPVLAAATGMLLAVPQGVSTVLWTLGLYFGVQALESYLVTPLLQQEKVSLPPAFIIGMQLLMGVLFGLIGLALATPFAALAMSLTHDTYVNDYLDAEADGRDASRR